MNVTKKTILIVDDDEDMQFYFSIILSDPDLELVRAENGQEALSIIDSGKKIDLILLDIVMPVMNGEEFFRVLRLERKLSIPVIFCSVDETRANPLKTIGPLHGIFLKGQSSNELKDLIHKNVSVAGEQGQRI